MIETKKNLRQQIEAHKQEEHALERFLDALCIALSEADGREASLIDRVQRQKNTIIEICEREQALKERLSATIEEGREMAELVGKLQADASFWHEAYEVACFGR